MYFTERVAADIIFPQKRRFQRNYRVKFPTRIAAAAAAAAALPRQMLTQPFPTKLSAEEVGGSNLSVAWHKQQD